MAAAMLTKLEIALIGIAIRMSIRNCSGIGLHGEICIGKIASPTAAIHIKLGTHQWRGCSSDG